MKTFKEWLEEYGNIRFDWLGEGYTLKDALAAKERHEQLMELQLLKLKDFADRCDEYECNSIINKIDANEIKKLKFQLRTRMNLLREKDRRCQDLVEKLDKAVEALKHLELYVAFNGDDWVQLRAREALKEIGVAND